MKKNSISNVRPPKTEPVDEDSQSKGSKRQSLMAKGKRASLAMPDDRSSGLEFLKNDSVNEKFNDAGSGDLIKSEIDAKFKKHKVSILKLEEKIKKVMMNQVNIMK